MLQFYFAGAQIPANPIGLNPPSLKWNQINTDRVQVIFPNNLEAQGQRVANIVNFLWDNPGAPIGNQNKKVSIILQNQTSISNGFVTVGPFRSEFFTMPPQYDITTSWLDLLAIHEYRHVQQFANTQKGVTKVVKTLLGSWAWGGMFGASLPRWYFEGDAVDSESRLTASGRGRFPSFNMEYRSLVLDDIYYNYEKASAGSYKDFVPDWYALGYYMTSEARSMFGSDIWAKVHEDAVKFKGLFYPFSRSLKRHTGLNTAGLYETVRGQMKNKWSSEISLRKNTESPNVSIINNNVKSTNTNYNNPIPTLYGVLVQKSAFNEVPSYYFLSPNGLEQKVTEAGILLDQELSTLSYSNNQFCWAELAFHPRWGYKNYSIIKVYDLNSGSKRKVIGKSRYFSPALSPDASKIVAIEVPEDLSVKIVVLNSQTGEVLNQLPNPENAFFSFPKWTTDGAHLIVVKRKDEKHELVQIDIKTGVENQLTYPLPYAISHPYLTEKYIFLSAGFSNVNNIYAIRLSDRAVFQVTHSILGAFQPSVDEEEQLLYYSEFSSKGYNSFKMPIEPENWQQIDLKSLSVQQFNPTLNDNNSILSNIPATQFPVKKYSQFTGLINPHSILAVLEPPIVGANILSDNKLSTLSAQAGGLYNLNEQAFSWVGELSYAGLFPVINAGYQKNDRSANFFIFEQIRDTSVKVSSYSENWTEDNFYGGFAIPLNLTTGNFFTNVRLSANWHHFQVKTDNNIDLPNISRDTVNGSIAGIRSLNSLLRAPLRNGTFNSIDLNFRFSAFKRRALQHLNPRLGILADFRYRTLVNAQNYQGNALNIRADLYFPGFSKNHSFYLNLAYQESAFLDNYKFSNYFFYPRGYSSVSNDNVSKLGINYTLPLLYPDLPVGPLAFLKRVKTNIFADIGRIDTGFPFEETPSLNTYLNSFGMELRFDVRFLRLLEVDLGLRYSYLSHPEFASNGSQHQFDFLLISISN